RAHGQLRPGAPAAGFRCGRLALGERRALHAARSGNESAGAGDRYGPREHPFVGKDSPGEVSRTGGVHPRPLPARGPAGGRRGLPPPVGEPPGYNARAMPYRPVASAALLLAASCHEGRTPERLAAEYAAAPKDHWDDLSRASQRALRLVFDTEPLPEAPGASCKAVESRAERLRFDCANAEGQSRQVLLLREEGAWRVAETNRAYRLLRKAPLEVVA